VRVGGGGSGVDGGGSEMTLREKNKGGIR